jgi:hypothetical protein
MPQAVFGGYYHPNMWGNFMPAKSSLFYRLVRRIPTILLGLFAQS